MCRNSVCDAYDTGPRSCSKAAPRPFCEASHCMVMLFGDQSSRKLDLGDCTASASCLHRPSPSVLHHSYTSFLVTSLSGAVTFTKFGANFPRNVTIPGTVSSSSLVVGGDISRMPCVFTGSGRNPSADST